MTFNLSLAFIAVSLLALATLLMWRSFIIPEWEKHLDSKQKELLHMLHLMRGSIVLVALMLLTCHLAFFYAVKFGELSEKWLVVWKTISVSSAIPLLMASTVLLDFKALQRKAIKLQQHPKL